MPRKVIESPEHLASVLDYDPITGLITHKSGKPAGWINNGYIRIGKFQIYGHRIAFYKMTGRWPDEIDHINHNTLDNSWANLREADRFGNNRNIRAQKNNKLGLLNISLQPNGDYDVRVGKFFRARTYDLEIAKAMVMEAREKYYGEFA
jgi:hypothetical protein